jgi:DNA-binding response OmpR family regulator
MQVLLVEDNALLAAAVVRALKTAGFTVNHVSTGESALLVIKTSNPDIVILDLGLPDIDGLEVLRISPIHC